MCIRQPDVDQKIDRNASYSRQVASLVSRNKEYCLKAQINKFVESCDLKQAGQLTQLQSYISKSIKTITSLLN